RAHDRVPHTADDALAAVDPDSADGASKWRYYVSAWTAWNNVRAILSIAAAGTLTVALRVGATS
ncbi:MAG TPA: hypothetical protein VFV63_02210, partial [Ilumatobacteraceae bacterium]|nr:hypothetical protein [Ilumatobacteraceae bacterium]